MKLSSRLRRTTQRSHDDDAFVDQQYDEAVFDDDELQTIDDVLRDLDGMNGREVSDLSHEAAGWRLTDEGDTIPYTAALIPREQPLTPTAAAQASAVAQRYGIPTSN